MLSTRVISRGSFKALSIDRPGSYPTMFMPRAAEASRAVLAPMCPRPMTARVLPMTSRPPNRALSFSTRSLASPRSPSDFMWLMPSTTRREPRSMPQRTSSFTALALAPGVLKTGMPSSVMRATGMLLVPAPHRAMARTVWATSSSLSLWLRRRMAWALAASEPSGRTSKLTSSKRFRPMGLILLKHLTWNLPGLYDSRSPYVFHWPRPCSTSTGAAEKVRAAAAVATLPRAAEATAERRKRARLGASMLCDVFVQQMIKVPAGGAICNKSERAKGRLS
mmetsp:Transcript_34401/g.101124  ORF Transcript_34401/g.101124 Transcript_34401/m.101124 type:complete len:279 (+) Transcript_34401:2280-3116(+)